MMSKSAKLLVFLIFLKILLVSTQENNSIYLMSGFYLPNEHVMVKYIVSVDLKMPAKPYGSMHICAGSIINPKFILTAAHCFWDEKTEEFIEETAIQIVAKTPNLLKRTQHTEILDVEDIIIHPYFDYSQTINDIAILHLASHIHEDDVYAQRIIFTDGPAEVRTQCTVVGWGFILENKPISADALFTDIHILEESSCEEIFHRRLNGGMLCAGDLEDIDRSSCKGDTGGPLLCHGKIAGVMSFALQCSVEPSVYSDVWYYRDWIYEVAGDGKSSNSISTFKILLLLLLVWIFS